MLSYAPGDICCRGNHILPQCIMNGPSPASHLDACEQFFYIYIFIRVFIIFISWKLFSLIRERRWHTAQTVFTSDGNALFFGCGGGQREGVNATVCIECVRCNNIMLCEKNRIASFARFALQVLNIERIFQSYIQYNVHIIGFAFTPIDTLPTMRCIEKVQIQFSTVRALKSTFICKQNNPTPDHCCSCTYLFVPNKLDVRQSTKNILLYKH